VRTNKPKPLSVLSLDIGSKKIGLAGCDPLGITITRLDPLIRNIFEKDIEMLKMYCKKRKVKGLVVGIPLDDKGRSTKQSEQCQKYGKRIAIELSLPIAWVNEHSSSWAAAEQFKLHNNRNGDIDCAVACLLLEQWLREGPELKPVPLAFQSE
tara:strand:+ start:361 stop:819 length:459 start_codon:yes stop_codon:yes gene_type:complete